MEEGKQKKLPKNVGTVNFHLALINKTDSSPNWDLSIAFLKNYYEKKNSAKYSTEIDSGIEISEDGSILNLDEAFYEIYSQQVFQTNTKDRLELSNLDLVVDSTDNVSFTVRGRADVYLVGSVMNPVSKVGNSLEILRDKVHKEGLGESMGEITDSEFVDTPSSSLRTSDLEGSIEDISSTHDNDFGMKYKSLEAQFWSKKQIIEGNPSSNLTKPKNGHSSNQSYTQEFTTQANEMNTHSSTSTKFEKRLGSGITICDNNLGTGPIALPGDQVSILYALKMKNKDSEELNLIGEPKTYVLGSGEVIKCLDMGIIGMSATGRRLITAPFNMVYGGTNESEIPGRTLEFEVQLVDIKKKNGE